MGVITRSARRIAWLTLLTLLLGLSGANALADASPEVNIYSYRQPQLIRPMLEVFTAKTGITVNTVYAKTGMLERLRNEGINSPADVVFTVDIGRLVDLKKAGLTQPLVSTAIARTIPSNVRDPHNHWFGLTERARILVTAKGRVAAHEIKRYEDLAAAKWKQRICTRSGKHAYSLALIASMIHQHGSAAAQTWLAALRSNLARTPQGNDRAQVKAIVEGVCDVALINHYYLHIMHRDERQKAWVEALQVVFPNQHDRGVHMNISGMAMAKYAPNRDHARQLMEFLASEEAQKMYAERNGEYPVDPNIPVSDYLQSLGTFKRDTAALAKVAANRAAAAKMVDRVGYND